MTSLFFKTSSHNLLIDVEDLVLHDGDVLGLFHAAQVGQQQPKLSAVLILIDGRNIAAKDRQMASLTIKNYPIQVRRTDRGSYRSCKERDFFNAFFSHLKKTITLCLYTSVVLFRWIL